MSDLDEAKTILVNTLIGILDNDYLKYQTDPDLKGVFIGTPSEKETLLVEMEGGEGVYFKLYQKNFISITKLRNRISIGRITMVNERLTRKVKQRYDWVNSRAYLKEINSFLDFLPKEKQCTNPKPSSKKLLSERRSNSSQKQ
jgi:hypothetical protein